MGRNLGAEIRNLPAEERAEIERRADELRAELRTVDALRGVADGCRREAARTLGLAPAELEEAERRADASLQALRDYVESQGGRMELAIHLPGRPTVRLHALTDLQQDDHERGAQSDSKTSSAR